MEKEITGFEVDVLAIGPHPDDVDLCCGGVLLRLHKLGYKTAIVDLTRGEMGNEGTPEIRAEEAERARELLGVSYRENLGLPDTGVEDTMENRFRVACVIRKYRPRLILSPFYEAHPPGRGLGHTDHYKAGHLISNAHNLAHLKKVDCPYPPHYARAVFYYMLPPRITPTFVVDVTEHYERWLEAVFAFKSQFASADPEHNARVKAYFTTWAQYWGSLIGAKYGQPFYTPQPLAVYDPMELVKVPHPMWEGRES